MNTRQVADQLKTDPKRLRRFLRADPTYRNAGQGGHYEFTDKDMPTLRKRFEAWCAKTAKPAGSTATTRRARKSKKDVPAMDVSIATKRLTESEREKRDKLSRERVDRLEQRLKSAGLHVSQARDRSRI